MKYTLLAIQPKYVAQIKDGSKLYEFRKVIPNFNLQNINKTIIIYCSSPIKAIVGEFEIDKIISMPFEDLIKEINIKEEQSIRLKAYFSNKTICHAIKIKNFIEYKNKITLEELRNIEKGFVAPQNYRFIKKETFLL